MTQAAVLGWGTALPERRLTNAELEATFDTSDEWIFTRTGIRERRVARPDESTVSLAADAGAAAIKQAGLTPDDVELLVVSTVTPDQALPATSALVHEALGLGCGAFDVGAGCAGFVYALVVAASLVATGASGPALIIGADTLTRIVDPMDRGMVPLFGDAGAAVVVGPAVGNGGLLGSDFGCDGSASKLLEIPQGERYMRMEGREVFRRAVRVVVDSAQAALSSANRTVEEIALFVPHQANGRIIAAAAERIGVPPERTMVNVDRFGNTSAASIPLALAEAAESGKLAQDDLVLLSGFGAGMTWASAVLQWGT